MGCNIVWFRRDLRLEDNPALVAAARGGGSVVPVYIWCPNEEAQFHPGRVSRWWLKMSLVHLDQSLKVLGVPLLILKATDTLSALLKLIQSTGATQLFYNRLYGSTMFLRSIDASSRVKNAKFLCETIEEVIREVGEDNVVQVVTDNAANYVAAGKLLMERHPKIFWTPCAAHCIDLMLEDIGKLVWVKSVVTQAKNLCKFIYNHALVLSTMRQYTKGKELARPGITRFASNFITLKSLLTSRLQLRCMFVGPELCSSSLATSPAGIDATKCIYDDEGFWEPCSKIVEITEPLVSLLRVADGEKPSMGYIYEGMDRVKEAIKAKYVGVEENYGPIWDIIDRRWQNQLHKPIHAAAYYLNPAYRFRDDFKADEEVLSGLYTVISKMSPNPTDILLEMDAYNNASGAIFSSAICKEGRTKLQPDPISLVRDYKLKQQLTEKGYSVFNFNGDLLYESWQVYDEIGNAFTRFNDFWEKYLNMPFDPEAPLLPPRKLVPSAGVFFSCTIEELGLETETEKNSNALLERKWSPGWNHADKALDRFLAGSLLEYAKQRKKVDGCNTSFLSPHIHFGELSVRKVFHLVRRKQIIWSREGKANAEESVNLFLRSIGLREYSRYLCFNFPFPHERPLLGNLRFFPWRQDEGLFKAWRQGRTGYPFVDAGMRQLWATGWLHNTVRVIVSSFYVKFLQLPWTWGMKYFWDTLLDADIECDILGWQYVSGSLPDGHELDRIENPQADGCKYDPDGEYVRQWLPELARMPTKWIHHPWNAPIAVLNAAGVELGVNYPRPIVEKASAQERLQHALSVMWERDATARREEGSGDTIEVQGTGGPLHEKMVVPKVVVMNKSDPSVYPWSDQQMPCISIAPRVPEAPCVRNNTSNLQISPSKSEKVPTAVTEASFDSLRKSEEQNHLLRVRLVSIENNEHSTAASSSVKKTTVLERKPSSIPLWSQLANSDLETASEQAGLQSSVELFGQKRNLQLFNHTIPMVANKVEDEAESSVNYGWTRPTKRQSRIGN